METEHIAAKLTISPPQKKPSPLSSVEWRSKELVALAEALKESLTRECLALYIETLDDLSDDQFGRAIRRAMRELEWFPKPAKLREFAGASDEDQRDVEAEAAWVCVNEYLRKWGVDCLPVYSGGKRREAPCLPPRIAYSLRNIGGLWALNQMTVVSRPFLQKAFIEAYNQAPTAERLAPQLSEMFGDKKLAGQVKQLMGRSSTATDKPKSPVGGGITIGKRPPPKTDDEIRNRREMLRQQNALLAARYSAKSAAPSEQAKSQSKQEEILAQ